MGWKKLLLGEKMPDKDDPMYQKRYEDEVDAGRKFARAMRLDLVAGRVQRFANGHKRLFLSFVFGFILLCLAWNIFRIVKAYGHEQSTQSATERQEEVLRQRHNKINDAINHTHGMAPVTTIENQMNNN